MTANQCRRNFLPPVEIAESFSLCSYRNDADTRETKFLDAITQCCTAPVKQFWCWNYCAVQESEFDSWVDCIEKIRDSTWGTACQKADHSIVTFATTSSSTTSTPLPTPLESRVQPMYPASTTSEPLVIPTNSWDLGANGTPTGGSNGTNTTGGLTSPTFVQAGSPKTLVLSTGGMICALLALSALAL